MQSETISAVLTAPSRVVFNYLSDPTNLPEWATEFCLGLSEENGVFTALTPMGELIIDIEADLDSGVIDMYASTDGCKGLPLATRALPISEAQTLYTVTLIREPSVPDATYQQQLGSLRKEMDNLRSLFRA